VTTAEISKHTTGTRPPRPLPSAVRSPSLLVPAELMTGDLGPSSRDFSGPRRPTPAGSVCAFYALFAIVILTFWRTSSWLGIDGLVASYRQHHEGQLKVHLHLPKGRGATGTVRPVHKAA
jgi:hypothetical protein